MSIGVIGLGKMGYAMVARLCAANHAVISFDLDPAARNRVEALGSQITDDLAQVCVRARIIILMVPAGDPVDMVIHAIAGNLKSGDIIIDAGNSHYIDSQRRAADLKERGVEFLDCGTSGGVHGLKNGFCLMVGGSASAYGKALPYFLSLASSNGVAHVGPSGAGHYVKMVHNGIEYGLLQAYAEGFQLLKEGSLKNEQLDLKEISRLWNTSSVIRSFLLELAHNVFEKDQNFDDVSGALQEGGTGKWTVEEAHKTNIPVPVIEDSLAVRAWSRLTGGNYATKLIALLRNQFGGHAVGTTKK